MFFVVSLLQRKTCVGNRGGKSLNKLLTHPQANTNHRRSAFHPISISVQSVYPHNAAHSIVRQVSWQKLFSDFPTSFAPNLLLFCMFGWFVYGSRQHAFFATNYFHDFGTFLAQRYVPFCLLRVPYLATAIEMIGGPLIDLGIGFRNGWLLGFFGISFMELSLSISSKAGCRGMGHGGCEYSVAPLHDVLVGGGNG